MNRRRPIVPQRVPIFVGCEGQSEQSYVALLGRITEQRRIAVHLDALVLQPGGGDPCSIVERAARRLEERRRKRGSAYHASFVLLDDDRIGQSADRDARLKIIAAKAGLQLIWQSPCHEALLLRHLDGCANLRPQTSALADEQLRQRWPEYEKASAANQLASRLDWSELNRAAVVEPDLMRFLQCIGLVEPQ